MIDTRAKYQRKPRISPTPIQAPLLITLALWIISQLVWIVRTYESFQTFQVREFRQRTGVTRAKTHRHAGAPQANYGKRNTTASRKHGQEGPQASNTIPVHGKARNSRRF